METSRVDGLSRKAYMRKEIKLRQREKRGLWAVVGKKEGAMQEAAHKTYLGSHWSETRVTIAD